MTFSPSEDLSVFFLGRGGRVPFGGFPLLPTELRDTEFCRHSKVALTAQSKAVKDRDTHRESIHTSNVRTPCLV